MQKLKCSLTINNIYRHLFSVCQGEVVVIGGVEENVVPRRRRENMLGLYFLSVAKRMFQNFKFGAAKVNWDVVFSLKSNGRMQLSNF